jgi:hypothetical protein
MMRPAAILLLIATLGVGGCFAPPIVIASAGLSAFQTGTTAFIRGELEYADAVPLEIMYEAVGKAVDDLQFTRVSERMRPNFASIVVQETGGRAVKIVLERKTPLVTKVKIRVGVFGDQAVARLVQQAAEKQIPADLTPPPVVPAEPRPVRPGPTFPE